MWLGAGLGLVLLLTAHGQVWPWLVSEKLKPAHAAARDGAAPEDAPGESSRRRPLAVLATLPDPSPLRNVRCTHPAATERAASIDRGPHAAGSPEGPGAADSAAFDGRVPMWEAPRAIAARIEPAAGRPVVRDAAIGTSILPHAPPA